MSYAGRNAIQAFSSKNYGERMQQKSMPGTKWCKGYAFLAIPMKTLCNSCEKTVHQILLPSLIERQVSPTNMLAK